MKVNLITRHAVPNYGSLLQTFATYEVLKSLDCDCQIIDYIREDEKSNGICLALLKRNTKWNKNFFRRFIFVTYNGINYRLMYYLFKKRNNFLAMNKTKEYNSIEELKKDVPEGDVFCSGSDQLWGSVGSSDYDPAYFLKFVPKEKKCISYAGSFGTDVICDELSKKLCELFEDYSSISVREQSAKNILSNQKIKSEIVLDPTLLLEKKQWQQQFELKNNEKSKYILIYQLHNNKEFDNYVKNLAIRKKMKIFRITSTLYNAFKKGKKFYLPSVGKFLDCFYNAQYVITDSFHGTVFSIIFNKQFANISPGVTSTRIDNLLKTFGLSDRMLHRYDDFELLDKDIEWKSVNKKLSSLREESVEWLKKSIDS
ncbi:MAG: polysaccharide pyruvyl transferase family protein [Bacilli bacterium]|nr:polysaccharide pyruvyl transferase family protein [Bacilli bacterium]